MQHGRVAAADAAAPVLCVCPLTPIMAPEHPNSTPSPQPTTSCGVGGSTRNHQRLCKAHSSTGTGINGWLAHGAARVCVTWDQSRPPAPRLLTPARLRLEVYAEMPPTVVTKLICGQGSESSLSARTENSLLLSWPTGWVQTQHAGNRASEGWATGLVRISGG